MNREYLGDGVYAEYDGYHIRLFLHNGIEEKNEIFLDPYVYIALTKYKERIYEKFYSQPGEEKAGG